MSKVKAEGFAELQEALKALPGEVSEKYMTRALRKGAKIVLNRTKAAAPRGKKERNRRYAHLQDDLSITTSNKQNASVANVQTNDAYWGNMLEWGTKKMKPHAFMAAALESVADQVVGEISESLAADIEKSFEQKTKS
jgi:HK97 gp10 family phage protein